MQGFNFSGGAHSLHNASLAGRKGQVMGSLLMPAGPPAPPGGDNQK